MKAVIEVWPKHDRCWLKINDKTVGEKLSVPKDLPAWARGKITQRINGIDKHVEKLKRQIDDLLMEREDINYYKYSPDDYFRIETKEHM